MTERLLFKPSEVAEAIGTSKTTVYDLINKGELAAVRVGSDLRVPVAVVQKWIAKQLATK